MSIPSRRIALLVAALATAGCGSDGAKSAMCIPACGAESVCVAGICVAIPRDASALVDAAMPLPPDLWMLCNPRCSGGTPFCVGLDRCAACALDADCAPGQVCRQGRCVIGCSDDARCQGTGTDGGAMTSRCCAMTCVDPASDVSHCGACGHGCAIPNAASRCVAGSCLLGTCNAGWADCDADPSDGCEVNTRIDVNHCGRCQVVCSLPHAIAGCANQCFLAACDFGYDDCNGDQGDGCETSVLSDAKNCGQCQKSCGVPAHGKADCENAGCAISACDAGWADCDRAFGNGCERLVLTDKANCGACGNACPINLVCAAGGCTCANCNIPNSKTACVNQQCVWAACLAGYGDCDGNKVNGCEVDLDSDSLNCGACGRACPKQQSCSGGLCTDPVLAFDFEENGGNAVKDGSPLHNDGTLAGGFARVAGRSGNGVHFDGTASIVVPDAQALDPVAITLEVWVNFDRCTVNQAGIQDILGKDLWDGAGGRQYLLNQQQAGFFRAHALVNGTFNYIDGVTHCVVGAWTHLAETYDGTTLTLYVNGKVDAQKAFNGPLQSTNTALTMGEQASGSYRVSGTVDTVRIYPYARSANDIASDAK